MGACSASFAFIGIDGGGLFDPEAPGPEPAPAADMGRVGACSASFTFIGIDGGGLFGPEAAGPEPVAVADIGRVGACSASFAFIGIDGGGLDFRGTVWERGRLAAGDAAVWAFAGTATAVRRAAIARVSSVFMDRFLG